MAPWEGGGGGPRRRRARRRPWPASARARRARPRRAPGSRAYKFHFRLHALPSAPRPRNGAVSRVRTPENTVRLLSRGAHVPFRGKKREEGGGSVSGDSASHVAALPRHLAALPRHPTCRSGRGPHAREGRSAVERLAHEHTVPGGSGLSAACPISTGRGTRRVQLVREEGRDVST